MISPKRGWMAGLFILLAASSLGAQDRGRADSRDQLQARRDSLAQVLVLLDADDERTGEVERRIAVIEQRLRIGDFRPGDMVSLDVRGREEYTGNFPVQPDQTLDLPGIDPIPLNGVLFSEATDVIHDALSVVLRNPVVELTFQMRLAVTGQVAEPGFYDVPGSILLSDLLQLAGGPTQAGALDKLEVRRDGQTIMSGESVATRGFTLDDLGLRSGDVVNIPETQDTFYTLRNVSILLGAVLSVAAIIALF